MARLSPRERASWTIRVVAHGLTSRRPALASGAIPRDWPIPRGARIALDMRGDTTNLYALLDDNSGECVAVVIGGVVMTEAGRPESVIRCMETTSLARERFHEVPRALPSIDTIAASAGIPAATSPWGQYRGDAAKQATVSFGRGIEGAWIASLGGEIRSSAAVVGTDIVIGTHATGTLASIDLSTGAVRWRATLPNWIHEDAVSDGATVVVSFGDNGPSFFSRAPAGVAAYRARDGVLLWTAFESNSVMSSPVVSGHRVVYATAGGILRARDIHTGVSLGDGKLSGAVQMAPPAIVGDTVVIAMDPDRICALLSTTLQNLWCREIRGAVSASTSAPTIAGGIVLQTGATPMSVYRIPQQLRRLGPRRYAQSALDIARGQSYRPAGQALFALHLSDGTMVWQSPEFPASRFIRGHSSGTVAVSNDVGVVVLPIPNIVLAFDVQTGHELWRAPGEQARGPALIADSSVYVFGANGVIRVLRAYDGAVKCSYKSTMSFDRAGPVAAGQTLIFGTVSGKVLAVPRRVFNVCERRTLQQLFGPEGTAAIESAPH